MVSVFLPVIILKNTYYSVYADDYTKMKSNEIPFIGQICEAYKGILYMCRDIPRYIAEEAAQTCIDASACRYTYLKKALSRLMNHEKADTPTGLLPEHENIRGRDSYQ